MKDFNGQIVVRRLDDGALGHIRNMPVLDGVQCVEVTSDRDILETWELDDCELLELSPSRGHVGESERAGEPALPF